MERVRVAPEYSPKWLEVERPQPLCDEYLESLFTDTATGFRGIKPDHSLAIHEQFKEKATKFIFESTLNTLSGIDTFPFVGIMAGCTQFIDNIYMQGPVQVLRGDYRYHDRLGLAYVKDVGSLIPDIPLIVAMPFPSIGALHHEMEEILEECRIKNIHVHIDGAWLTCSRDVIFNFNNPVIKSVGISLSKGLGLGWNRIGLRWAREQPNDSISIMNDFHMENRMPTMVANYVLDNVSSDYLWTKYGDLNARICKDFELTPSKAIHMAFNKAGGFVGLTPLLRHLIKEDKV
jgi:hypothetical protein